MVFLVQYGSLCVRNISSHRGEVDNHMNTGDFQLVGLYFSNPKWSRNKRKTDRNSQVILLVRYSTLHLLDFVFHATRTEINKMKWEEIVQSTIKHHVTVNWTSKLILNIFSSGDDHFWLSTTVEIRLRNVSSENDHRLCRGGFYREWAQTPKVSAQTIHISFDLKKWLGGKLGLPYLQPPPSSQKKRKLIF